MFLMKTLVRKEMISAVPNAKQSWNRERVRTCTPNYWKKLLLLDPDATQNIIADVVPRRVPPLAPQHDDLPSDPYFTHADFLAAPGNFAAGARPPASQVPCEINTVDSRDETAADSDDDDDVLVGMTAGQSAGDVPQAVADGFEYKASDDEENANGVEESANGDAGRVAAEIDSFPR